MLRYRDRVVGIDSDSSDGYKRVSSKYDNRFISKHLAGDYVANILAYRKDPHIVVSVDAVSDPTIQPLDVVGLVDEGLGFTSADKFFVANINYTATAIMKLRIVKI